MAQVRRRTIVVHDRLAMRELRLDAARHRRHGLQIITFEQLASRLAVGLSRPVDDESLRAAIQEVLASTDLGELDGIKDLPGMVSAAVDTLRKAWLAEIDLHARAADHPRLHSMAALEEAVRDVLSAAMLRPADLVRAALQRLDFPRPHAGGSQVRRWTRPVRLGRLDARERACRFPSPLRAPARSQLLALAAWNLGGPPPLRSHHSHRRARSATGR